MTETSDKLKDIINNATDDVTTFFESHYIPKVSKEEYELAKAKMREILEGYNGKDNIPEDVMPFYNAWSWKVYSYSKERMIENMEDMDKRRALHNFASMILDTALRQLELVGCKGCNALQPSQMTAFYTCMERGIIRGTENLEIMIRQKPEAFHDLCSFLELILMKEKNENQKILPIVVYPSPKCGAWFGQI
jgi:hypothetical protein